MDKNWDTFQGSCYNVVLLAKINFMMGFVTWNLNTAHKDLAALYQAIARPSVLLKPGLPGVQTMASHSHKATVATFALPFLHSASCWNLGLSRLVIVNTDTSEKLPGPFWAQSNGVLPTGILVFENQWSNCYLLIYKPQLILQGLYTETPGKTGIQCPTSPSLNLRTLEVEPEPRKKPRDSWHLESLNSFCTSARHWEKSTAFKADFLSWHFKCLKGTSIPLTLIYLLKYTIPGIHTGLDL